MSRRSGGTQFGSPRCNLYGKSTKRRRSLEPRRAATSIAARSGESRPAAAGVCGTAEEVDFTEKPALEFAVIRLNRGQGDGAHNAKSSYPGWTVAEIPH
jgi:hypothetical protein